MEILIGIAVIFILMLCLGAGVELIVTVALGFLGLFIIFMAAVFLYAFTVMIMSEKTKGCFTRSFADDKNRIPFAYYMIDESEYKNMFPLEVIFQKKLYREGKEVKLLFNRKKKCCFDNNAVICCILGVFVSVFLIVEMITLIAGNL